MNRYTYTGSSKPNARRTHILEIGNATDWVEINTLVISTSGGDVAADLETQIIHTLTTSAGTTNTIVWKGNLRSAKEFGKEFHKLGMFEIGEFSRRGAVRNRGRISIKTYPGGANVCAIISCAYVAYSQAEVDQGLGRRLD